MLVKLKLISMMMHITFPITSSSQLLVITLYSADRVYPAYGYEYENTI